MHQGVEKFIEAEQRRKTSGVCWWVTGVWSCLTGNRMSGTKICLRIILCVYFGSIL
ncbi:hypothetical protein HanXRQr2_Chr07g0288601 [Helianthus annuus]|uniref:Uncharacterized protein n=1 Tax=Helianthus annuus TaxID=4232 RepID=A0A9K3IK43_HELAN|nr:hypothetical protein HanXRQr2_Chr07g0288601 [Helianthus annuus]KAJ0904216.1 hypothetical protein HanPSC8_Chr07g0279441 [Helianthus annuus]